LNSLKEQLEKEDNEERAVASKLREEVADLTVQVESLTSEKNSQKGNISELTSRIGVAELEKDKLSNALQELSKEAEVLKTELDEKQAALLKEKESLEADFQEKTSEFLKEKESLMAHFQEKVDEVEKEKEKTQSLTGTIQQKTQGPSFSSLTFHSFSQPILVFSFF